MPFLKSALAFNLRCAAPCRMLHICGVQKTLIYALHAYNDAQLRVIAQIITLLNSDYAINWRFLMDSLLLVVFCTPIWFFLSNKFRWNVISTEEILDSVESFWTYSAYFFWRSADFFVCQSVENLFVSTFFCNIVSHASKLLCLLNRTWNRLTRCRLGFVKLVLFTLKTP